MNSAVKPLYNLAPTHLLNKNTDVLFVLFLITVTSSSPGLPIP